MNCAVAPRFRLILTLRMSSMCDNRPTEKIVDPDLQSFNFVEVNKCEDKEVEGSVRMIF